MSTSLIQSIDVAGTALQAQAIRLNTIASNLANAETVSSTEDGAYRSKQPVFAQILKDEFNDKPAGGVKVVGITESDAKVQKRYAPSHPLANEQGYIYTSNVNTVEEMANMKDAEIASQSAIETIVALKRLASQTLALGK